MRQPDTFELSVGRYARERLGAATKVVRYGDDYGERDMFLVSGADFPDYGVTSYATVGLSKIAQHVGEKQVHVEILGACASDIDGFDNVISSCVFDSVRNKTNIVHGSHVVDIISQYSLSNTMKHIVFVSPFLFPEFEKIRIDEIDIYWLMAIPISDDELEFLVMHGVDALEDEFERAQIDIYDIQRASCVTQP